MIIRIKESPRRRVIVSALQVVQSGFYVVVISSVPKRIVGSENGALQRRVAGCNGCCAVAPCVVGVSADLDTRFGIHRYNVTKDVFLKVECVKYACGITALAVLQTQGCAALVVKIQEHPLPPRFADNPRTIKSVDVLQRA